jgi:hypothetical protein
MAQVGRGEAMRIASAVAVVMALAASLVLVGDLHPDSKAVELLSSHHRERNGNHDGHRVHKSKVIEADEKRMNELSQLVDAADQQAKKASELRNQEADKLEVAPDSKVDAEEMLSHEAREKGENLDKQLSTIREDIKDLSKKLRRANHKARESGRLLHKVDGQERDAMIALHDKEMKVSISSSFTRIFFFLLPRWCESLTSKTFSHTITNIRHLHTTLCTQVLEARHDVQNAAKAGDVDSLREAQQKLANRKDIAMGARAEYDHMQKSEEQVKARTRLLEKRAKVCDDVFDTMRFLNFHGSAHV